MSHQQHSTRRLQPTNAVPSVPPRAKPLGVNRLDHQIRLRNGSTSALELSQQRIQLAKENPPLNLNARVEELTREVGNQRREIQFYREAFENLQRLRETCYNAYQQLFLANYHDHNFERLNELIVQLHLALEDSIRREVKAEKAWVEFWGGVFNEQELQGELI